MLVDIAKIVHLLLYANIKTCAMYKVRGIVYEMKESAFRFCHFGSYKLQSVISVQQLMADWG